MAKPGRRSRAEWALMGVALVDISRKMPPAPPAELSDPQACVWRDVMASLPATWLPRGGHAVLVEFCRRVCRSRLLEGEIARFDAEWINSAPLGLERLDKLLSAADRESRAIVALGRSLRLTPHSRQHSRSAARALDDLPTCASPWSGRDGEDA